jgi:hypothetical protein
MISKYHIEVDNQFASTCCLNVVILVLEKGLAVGLIVCTGSDCARVGYRLGRTV